MTSITILGSIIFAVILSFYVGFSVRSTAFKIRNPSIRSELIRWEDMHWRRKTKVGFGYFFLTIFTIVGLALVVMETIMIGIFIHGFVILSS